MNLKVKLKRKESSQKKRISFVLYSVTILLISLTGLLCQKDMHVILNTNVIAFIMVFVVDFYLNTIHLKNKFSNRDYLIALVGYVFSISSVFINKDLLNYNLWLIGPMLIAIAFDSHTGIFVQMMLSLLYSYSGSYLVEDIILTFLMGMLSSLLVRRLTNIHNMISISITVLSTNIILQLLSNDFIITKDIINTLVISSLTCLVYLCFVYQLNLFQKNMGEDRKAMKGKNNNKHDMVNGCENNALNGTCNNGLSTIADMDDKDRQALVATLEEKLEEKLDEILKEDYSLAVLLKEISPELYQHSLMVSEIAYLAAECIGANTQLSKAGGFYHEIGRIHSDNYILEGVKIAKEYDFPKEVIQMIEEQNVKLNKPKSIESIIVMLTENIINTIVYVENKSKGTSNQATISYAKLIETVFNNRLTSGMFDEFIMSIKDYKKLQEFYINYYVKN